MGEMGEMSWEDRTKKNTCSQNCGGKKNSITVPQDNVCQILYSLQFKIRVIFHSLEKLQERICIQ